MSFFEFLHKHHFVVGIVILLLAALFYLQKDIARFVSKFPGLKQPTERFLACDTERIDQDILSAIKSSDDQIRLLISFTEKPSADIKVFLDENGVTIYPDTWVYDYLVADTTVDRLCFIATLPGVTKLSLAE